VSVRAEPEVDQVELRRRAGIVFEQPLVGDRRRGQVPTLDRHRQQAGRGQRAVAHQDLVELRPIAPRVASGRDPLVHLADIDPVPRQFVFTQLAQHQPRGLTAAQCDDGLAALRDGAAANVRNLGGGEARGALRVLGRPQPHSSPPLAGGSYQPP